MSADREPSPQRLQLHLVLAYKHQPRQDPRIRRYLERGYRIEQLQRISDREVVVTLAVASPREQAEPA